MGFPTVNPPPNQLFFQICDPTSLAQAWAKVSSNRGCSGGDHETIHRFAATLPGRLARLAQALRNDAFAPGPYRLLEIEKHDGGVRPLAIPTVADRVILTACATALTPILDPLFSDDSFGYRPGRSVAMAVRRVDLLRRSGHVWVAEADIHRCFERIPHDPLMTRLETLLDRREPRLCALIGHWLEDAGQALGTPGRGLPQGSPLSPLLANLHLDRLDGAFEQGRVRLVRFADDFVLLAQTREAAEAALSRADRVLGEHGLELASEKTRVLDPDRGLEFLGHLFVRSIVMRQSNHAEEDPVTIALRQVGEAEHDTSDAAPDQPKTTTDRALYLETRGLTLDRRAMGYELRAADGRVMAALAAHRVDRIDLAPGTSITTEAIRLALSDGTPVAFTDGQGTTIGRLAPPAVDTAELQLLQAQAILGPDQRLQVARELVAARIANMRARLQVLNRTEQDAAVTATAASLGRVLRKLPQADTLDALRGHEGSAAAAYWPALAALVREDGMLDKGGFRRSRPAKDGLNAAVNYLTALLERDIHRAILRVGLHPGFGFLHASRDRADALVWDLMEGFRAMMTEGNAVTLINRRRFRSGMVSTDLTEHGAVRISPEGRRALIRGYEDLANGIRTCPHSGLKRSMRAIMEQEARALVRHLRDPEVKFQPARQDY